MQTESLVHLVTLGGTSNTVVLGKVWLKMIFCYIWLSLDWFPGLETVSVSHQAVSGGRQNWIEHDARSENCGPCNQQTQTTAIDLKNGKPAFGIL